MPLIVPWIWHSTRAINTELISYAKSALRSMFKPGYRYMKCGVMLTDILREGTETRDLFGNRDALRGALDGRL